MNWLLLSAITIITWGTMGLLIKLAYQHTNWPQIYILTNAIMFASSLLIYVNQKPSITVGSQGFNYVMIAGFVSVIGTIAFYSALQVGKAIVVIPLKSLY